MNDTGDSIEPLHASVGHALVHALTAGRLDELAAMFEPEATLSALLPDGFYEWQGTAPIVRSFVRWFGRVDEFEVLEAAVDRHGPRMQLWWRARVRGGRYGDADFVVEQHVYADPAPTGRIQHMSMLCSGFVQMRGTT
jgi:hypothetical protein